MPVEIDSSDEFQNTFLSVLHYSLRVDKLLDWWAIIGCIYFFFKERKADG